MNNRLEELLGKLKTELQEKYAQVVGQEPKPALSKEELAKAIIEAEDAKERQRVQGIVEQARTMPADSTPVGTENQQQGNQQPAPAPTTPAANLSPQDMEILAQNQGASPYELLSLGLSQEGFEALMLQQNAPASKPAASAQPSAPVEQTLPDTYQKIITPPVETPNLIQQQVQGRRDDVNDREDGNSLRPQLIGKVQELPGSNVAAQMSGISTPAARMPNLEQYADQQGMVTITNGKGNPQRVTRRTAERLAKIAPGEYHIVAPQ